MNISQICVNDFLEIMPVDCLRVTFEQSIVLLKNLISKEELIKAFDISKIYDSPVKDFKDTSWIKTAKIIGINPRITKTFWGIVKYAMSFPENAIHIMPLWETGDGSLYVQNSWELNDDFLDDDLKKLGYVTSKSQLKLIINVLHALGKTVGFDCLPHVDNFSEIVLLNPKYFEWVKLTNDKKEQIFGIDNNLIYLEVEEVIKKYLNAPDNLFELKEEERRKILFPDNIDNFKRRMELRNVVRSLGYETISVVEHSPMRPVLFDKIESNDKESWATFKVENKNADAKILGSITPYKWYFIDEFGYPVKNKIQKETWDYFIENVNNFQKEYNFDFLRADMAHNQISHSHNEQKDELNTNEFWRELKKKINQTKPYFSTFAEAFYNSYYIDCIKDYHNKNFDVVLGDMNFKEINHKYFLWLDDFLCAFRQNFEFSPCVAVFTNDGDLPIHQHLFSQNEKNKVRYFLSLFLNLPSYMGIGFETKDVTLRDSGFYSNQYVKIQEIEYSFGENKELFAFVCKMRKYYSSYKNIIEQSELSILDCNDESIFTWMYDDKIIFSTQLINGQKNVFSGFQEVYFDGNCAIYLNENFEL